MDRIGSLALLPFDMRERIERAAHPEDRDEIARTVGQPMPEFIARRFLATWAKAVELDGWSAGNDYMRAVREEYGPALVCAGIVVLPFDATEPEIEAEAERAAKTLRALTARFMAGRGKVFVLLDVLKRFAARYGATLPSVDTTHAKLARMVTVGYWRREFRKRFRRAEEIARRAGFVNRAAGVYVSEEAHKRHERALRGQRRFLESHQAVNLDTGEALGLAELWESSLANPRIRFVAMIKCLKGLRDRARDLGYTARMMTMTAPGRMHAYVSAPNRRNPRFDGTTPIEAQRYLARTWNSAKRALDRKGIKAGRDYFGARVVEPHHDGTPHWHVFLCCRPDCRDVVVSTLREYAMKDSPDEPGADLHRFNVKEEDPSKGDLVAYMVAYIAKATDGKFVGTDRESGTDATESAPRAVAWARTHGIRQFQFFGVGAVTPFREFFRLDRLPASVETTCAALYAAAQAGDFGAYLRASDESPVCLRVYRADEPSPTYPGEITRRLRGITVEGEGAPVTIVTRSDTWTIGRREPTAVDLPWTRFNNSAPSDSVDEEAAQAKSESGAGPWFGADEIRALAVNAMHYRMRRERGPELACGGVGDMGDLRSDGRSPPNPCRQTRIQGLAHSDGAEVDGSTVAKARKNSPCTVGRPEGNSR